MPTPAHAIDLYMYLEPAMSCSLIVITSSPEYRVEYYECRLGRHDVIVQTQPLQVLVEALDLPSHPQGVGGVRLSSERSCVGKKAQSVPFDSDTLQPCIVTSSILKANDSMISAQGSMVYS